MSGRGDPAVGTHAVARLLYDGDVVTGDRAGNRTISLPLLITGSTSLPRAAGIESLMAAGRRSEEHTSELKAPSAA